MATREERNLERARHWEWTWNNDVMRMVDECYAMDCEVTDMLRGQTFRGRESLREVEKQILAHDPSRRMKVNRSIASGDVVALEMDAIAAGGDRVTKACVILTFNDQGLIISDHTYASGGDAALEADTGS